MKTFEKDRKFIENKYHKTDEPFNPYNRMAYHGWECDISTGKSDEEIKEGLRSLSKGEKSISHPEAKAKAVEYVLENIRIDVNEHDWFVGFYSLNRLICETTKNKWDEEVFKKIIPETGDKMAVFNESGAVAIWPDYDHVVPDWNSLLTLGFPGILKRAEEYRKKHEKAGDITDEMAAYFRGIEIEYKAIISIVDRLYRLALRKKHEKAAAIAACLKSLHDGAPKNIYEAMQLIYIYFIISESIDTYQVRSLGSGLDNTLYNFYIKDLKEGTFTRNEIKEFLAYFFMQWSAIGNYWGQPFYLGGTKENGDTKVNDLTYDILEVYDKLDIYNPKIQIKVSRNTPESFLNKVFNIIRKGHNSFVFCCEPGMIKAVMSYGATYEEALNMDIRGCYETGVRANEVVTTTGYVNALKAVEYALYDGYDKRIKKQIGIKTGDSGSFKTFEQFYFAVLQQWSYLIESSIEMANIYEKYLGYVSPSSMYSATIETSLEKGFDAYQGGVKFNNSSVLNCGFASLVDAVMAVKEFVFDKKEINLNELKKVLDSDWNGYETLRMKIKNSKRKYGNGDEQTDKYTQAMAEYFAMKVNNRPNARGGVYKAIMHSAMQFIWQGWKTSATPGGRKSGEEISKNASPAPGADKNGVTSLINSVLKIRPSIYPESFCLDLMLHPSAVSGEEGLGVMKSLLGVYMENGGMSLQMNVFDTETLRDAQKNPENYQNLQIRVCGWNVLWNNLSRAEQDAYIERCENIK